MHHHAGAKRMEQNVHAVARQQIVGRDLVSRSVIGLRQNLSEDQMRRIEPAETVDAREQIGGDALHQPVHLAMNIGVEPAEIGDPRRRPHAAEEAVALDQQRAAARARGSHRGGNAGGSAADHRHFILAVERHLACGFFDGLERQGGGPGREPASCPGSAGLTIGAIRRTLAGLPTYAAHRPRGLQAARMVCRKSSTLLFSETACC